MLDILLVVQIVIAILLVVVILLQRSNSDGLLGTGGGAGGSIMTAQSAANFFVKTTMVLGVCFMINSIVLANLSTKKKMHTNLPLTEETQESEPKVPIAK